jgi:hypothetical protein
VQGIGVGVGVGIGVGVGVGVGVGNSPTWSVAIQPELFRRTPIMLKPSERTIARTSDGAGAFNNPLPPEKLSLTVE